MILPKKIGNLNYIKSITNIPKYYYFNFQDFSKKKKNFTNHKKEI